MGIPVLLGTDALSQLGITICFPKRLILTKTGHTQFWPLSGKDKESHKDRMSMIHLVTICDKYDENLVKDVRVDEYPKEIVIDENYFPPGKVNNIHNKMPLSYVYNSFMSQKHDEDIMNLEKGERDNKRQETQKNKGEEGLESRNIEEEVN